jgi:hypothetical protein
MQPTTTQAMKEKFSMGSFFTYFEFALSLLSVIPAFVALFTAKQQITGAQVQTDIQPALMALSAILPKFNPDPAITFDFCAAFAGVFNKYVAAAQGKPA